MTTQADRIEALEAQVEKITEALKLGDPTLTAQALADAKAKDDDQGE